MKSSGRWYKVPRCNIVDMKRFCLRRRICVLLCRTSEGLSHHIAKTGISSNIKVVLRCLWIYRQLVVDLSQAKKDKACSTTAGGLCNNKVSFPTATQQESKRGWPSYSTYSSVDGGMRLVRHIGLGEAWLLHPFLAFVMSPRPLSVTQFLMLVSEQFWTSHIFRQKCRCLVVFHLTWRGGYVDKYLYRFSVGSPFSTSLASMLIAIWNISKKFDLLSIPRNYQIQTTTVPSESSQPEDATNKPQIWQFGRLVIDKNLSESLDITNKNANLSYRWWKPPHTIEDTIEDTISKKRETIHDKPKISSNIADY